MTSGFGLAQTPISDLFTTHQVVSDVVPTAPNARLTVVFSDGAQVLGGNEMLIKATQPQPQISFPTETNTFYTLIMLDPDNDTRQTHKYRQFIHWGVVNIAGANGIQNLDVASGHVLSPYMGCAPEPGSGRHRYVVLLYRQPGVIPTDKLPTLGQSSTVGQLLMPNNFKERSNFDHHKFFQDHLGSQPTLVAGNFFFAEMPQ